MLYHPTQTVVGKGSSNPLKAGGLPKIPQVLWLIIPYGVRHHNKKDVSSINKIEFAGTRVTINLHEVCDYGLAVQV